MKSAVSQFDTSEQILVICIIAVTLNALNWYFMISFKVPITLMK